MSDGHRRRTRYLHELQALLGPFRKATTTVGKNDGDLAPSNKFSISASLFDRRSSRTRGANKPSAHQVSCRATLSSGANFQANLAPCTRFLNRLMISRQSS